MPGRPTTLRACAEPGCPELSTTTRCPDHTRGKRREWDAGRGTRTQRGLGNDWLRLRDQIVRDHVAVHGWTCPGWNRSAHPVAEGQLTGDHIVPRSAAPERALDPTNIGVLCLSCNSAKRDR